MSVEMEDWISVTYSSQMNSENNSKIFNTLVIGGDSSYIATARTSWNNDNWNNSVSPNRYELLSKLEITNDETPMCFVHKSCQASWGLILKQWNIWMLI